jgi:hypothetical protein
VIVEETGVEPRTVDVDHHRAELQQRHHHRRMIECAARLDVPRAARDRIDRALVRARAERRLVIGGRRRPRGRRRRPRSWKSERARESVMPVEQGTIARRSGCDR